MGAYYATYIYQDASEIELIVEQGQEINRDGEVAVNVNKQGMKIEVTISGTAVYVNKMMIEYC
jgi:predicted PhzF superfamily epimerase YddE/YHI9